MTKQRLIDQHEMNQLLTARFGRELHQYTQYKGNLYTVKYSYKNEYYGEHTFMIHDDKNAKYAIDQIIRTIQKELIKEKIIVKKSKYLGFFDIDMFFESDKIYTSCISLY